MGPLERLSLALTELGAVLGLTAQVTGGKVSAFCGC